MMSSTHIALALVAAKFVYTPGQPLEWALVGLGAIAPDFDAGGGMITHPSRLIPGLPRLFGRAIDSTTRLASQATREMVGHRGPLHYPLIALGLWLLATVAGWPWLRFVSVGYAAHIAADGFTRSGVPLLGPLSSRYFGFLPKKLRIRTGGALERILGLATWGYLGFFLYQVMKQSFNAQELLTPGNETIVQRTIDLLMYLIKSVIDYFL